MKFAFLLPMADNTISITVRHDGHPSFQVAAVLNLTPDHLERHGSMRNYAMTKCRIFSHMNDAKLAILPLGMYAFDPNVLFSS